MYTIDIKTFFEAYQLNQQPLLLGLSGGPDSMALFHLLLELNYPFHVAHVDHGWRQEGMEEATAIHQLCRNWGIPCWLRTLYLKGANLEDLSRRERHAFFQEVCDGERLHGVLLGHHADDQAETVLKRVFEGASLAKLRGLEPKTRIGKLIIYRPLLKVRKSLILKWLETKNISYFCDPTNRDPRYLRSRMRIMMLPFLSKQFGKHIETSLCRLSETAEELSGFLQTILDPFYQHIIRRWRYTSLDFNKIPLTDPFIYKAAIRIFFEKQRITLPHSVLETIFFHLKRNHAHKTIRVGKKTVEMNRCVLMIYEKEREHHPPCK